MFLSQFNFSQLIQSYNQANKTHIHIHENFGCGYLHRDSLESCQQMIKGINHSSDLFHFSESERNYMLRRRSQLNDWRNRIKSSTTSMKKMFEEFKKIYVLPPEITARKTLYEWRKQQYKYVKNSPLALHSAHAIFVIATEWLPNLMTHHKHALKDLKWHYFSMPRPIYIAYRQYLKNFLNEAKQFRKKLAEAMYERLKIASESELKHADVMLYVAQQAQIPHPISMEKLSELEFVQFHHYIQHYGDNDLQKYFGELHWFKSNEVFPLRVVGTKNTKILVPEFLMSSVPAKTRKPEWLFYGANLRFRLCEKHMLDFARLQYLPDVSKLEIDLSSILSVVREVNKLQEMKYVARGLLEEMQEKPYRELSILHFRTHKFLRDYQVVLHGYYKNTVSLQIDVLGKLVEKILNKQAEIVAALKTSSDVSLTLDNLLRAIQVSMTFIHDSDLKNRLFVLQDRCNKFLSLNRMVNTFKQIANENIVSEEDMISLKKTLGQVDAVNCCDWQNFSSNVARDILKNLQKELKRNPSVIQEEKELILHHQRIDQYREILKLIAPKYDACVIAKPLTKYFLYYLNAVLQCGTDANAFEKKAASLEKFERTIKCFTKIHDVYIGQNSCADYLSSLQQLRMQKNWYELQAEVGSLALILSEKFLSKHIDNACEKLDVQVQDLILQNKNKNVADNQLTAEIVFKIRDQLMASNKQTMDSEFFPMLKTYEQVLVGIKGPLEEIDNRSFVPILIQLSGQAHNMRHMVHDETLSYVDKTKQISALQKTFEQTVGTLRLKCAIPENFGRRKNAAPLFFKSYTLLEESFGVTEKSNLIINIK